MFLVGILDNCHEGIRKDGDQDRHNEEVTDEEEECQNSLSQYVVASPSVPCGWSKSHYHLKKGVSNRSRGINSLVAKGQCQGHEEATTADQDEHKNGHEIRSHHSKGNEQLRKIPIVVQDREEPREEQYRVCCQHIVGHISDSMLPDIRHNDAINPQAEMDEKDDQNA